MQERCTVPACLAFPSGATAMLLLIGGLLLLTMAGLRPSPASAQGFYYNGPSWMRPGPARRYYQRRYYPRPYYYGRRYYQRPYQRREQVRRPPARAPKVNPAWYPDKSEKDPTTIVISLSKQRVAVYQGDKQLVTSRVSSGKRGHATPKGVFSILSKARWHRSNIYSGAPMPYMQRLTWSGIALHASNSVPHYPASHGCVRLPTSFASQLFYFTKTGTHVVITGKSELAPEEIVHEKLFTPRQPARKDWDQLEIERALASKGIEVDDEEERASTPLRILITHRTGRERLMDVQRILNQLQFGAGEVDGVMGPDTAQAIRRFQETYGEAYDLPADGLVSDDLVAALYKVVGKPAPQNGHIYVRQDFKQLFDAPVTIRDPDAPLGDHLITAQYFEPGDKDIRWLSLSLGKAPKPHREASARHTAVTAVDQPQFDSPVEMPASSVGEALDRIEIPEKVRQRVGELLTPGSSIAISDDGLSHETHPKGTDFILLTDD